jgi:hypothetical protein
MGVQNVTVNMCKTVINIFAHIFCRELVSIAARDDSYVHMVSEDVDVDAI